MSKNILFWLIWLIGTASVGGYLAAAMFYGGDRSNLLIGKTTSGHHQIELSCNTCHGNGFTDADTIQKACLSCHENELKVAKDSHPIKKFRDPRNAARLEQLNAQKCVTCHTEHKPELVSSMGMGVTLPKDFCFKCHADVGKDRPHTHKDLNFEGCASSGCHNYHDNRALYERFLEKHAKEPEMKLTQLINNFNYEKLSEEYGGLKRGDPLKPTEANAPKEHINQKLLDTWHQDAHAKNGVNCSACHQPNKDKQAWIKKPGIAVCASCHKEENKSFLAGKHGMRLAPDLLQSKADPFNLPFKIFKEKKLSPMRPELARLPMKQSAHGTELSCNTCHSVGKENHKFNIEKAKVQACLSCHDDEHSKAYLTSPHHELWQKELKGELPKGSGVTCATCHMPRIAVEDEYENEVFIITHNQNDNLRPNEKMIRSVCSACHGLRFSIDSLADPNLIKKNFHGRSAFKIESIDWVLKRSSKPEETK